MGTTGCFGALISEQRMSLQGRSRKFADLSSRHSIGRRCVTARAALWMSGAPSGPGIGAVRVWGPQ